MRKRAEAATVNLEIVAVSDGAASYYLICIHIFVNFVYDTRGSVIHGLCRVYISFM